MSLSRKKVIVRKLSRAWLAGYLPASGLSVARDEAGKSSAPEYRSAPEHLEMLDLSGKVTAIALAEIKWICFVRDFNSGEVENPERLLRKNFAGRPRGEGLWLRLRLKDNDLIEGLAANDASLVGDFGIFVAPPDARSNTQRIFVPRSSIIGFEIVAVITPGKRKEAHSREQPANLQEDLFRSLP